MLIVFLIAIKSLQGTRINPFTFWVFYFIEGIIQTDILILLIYLLIFVKYDLIGIFLRFFYLFCVFVYSPLNSFSAISFSCRRCKISLFCFDLIFVFFFLIQLFLLISSFLILSPSHLNLGDFFNISILNSCYL